MSLLNKALKRFTQIQMLKIEWKLKELKSCQLHQHFIHKFYAHRSRAQKYSQAVSFFVLLGSVHVKEHKKTDSLTVFLCLGSVCIKFARKMLVKSTSKRVQS